MPENIVSSPLGLRNTRNSSRGRGIRRGSSTASPHANNQSFRVPGGLSPSQAELPPREQQQQQQQVLSSSAPLVHTDNTCLSDNTGVSFSSDGNNLEHSINQNKNTAVPTGTPPLAPDQKMGDNTGSGKEGDVHSSKTEPWHKALEDLRGMATHTCQELKTIGTQLIKLDKIEKSTDSLTLQMSGVLERTAELEGTSNANSTEITQLKQEVISLKAKINDQEETIASLLTLKEDLTKTSEEFKKMAQDRVDAFNGLIAVQQDQVDSFHTTSKKVQSRIKREVQQDMETEMEQWASVINYEALKKEARHNKCNLVIVGLQEEEDKSTLSLAKSFINSTLGIKNVKMEVAYRLGPPPFEGSSYARPILIHFPNLPERNKVWKGRTPITSEDGQRTIRIQQDLPKVLREDSQLLNRVQKAAAAIPKFQSSRIKDYKLILNGKSYYPSELEHLPLPIRPSTLAYKSSDSVYIFFSRHSPFSNHYPASFVLQDTEYANIEHYFAHQKAIKSGNKQLIHRAINAMDPLEAKAVLNILKNDQVQFWTQNMPEVLLDGLREKFKQNKDLRKFLLDTGSLKLGEASSDKTWGIGFTLEDRDALDTDKWTEAGNLLGRTLQRLRSEISPSGNKTKDTPSSPKDVHGNSHTPPLNDQNEQSPTKHPLEPLGTTHESPSNVGNQQGESDIHKSTAENRTKVTPSSHNADHSDRQNPPPSNNKTSNNKTEQSPIRAQHAALGTPRETQLTRKSPHEAIVGKDLKANDTLHKPRIIPLEKTEHRATKIPVKSPSDTKENKEQKKNLNRGSAPKDRGNASSRPAHRNTDKSKENSSPRPEHKLQGKKPMEKKPAGSTANKNSGPNHRDKFHDTDQRDKTAGKHQKRRNDNDEQK